MDKDGILGPNKGRYGKIRAIKGKYAQIRVISLNTATSLLVNFSCELGQIMTRYDFLSAR